MTRSDHSNVSNPAALKTIVIAGYGSQGKAHARNLRDSGYTVIVAARQDGASWTLARQDGFEVRTMADAGRHADLVALLTPDMAQPGVYAQMLSSLKPGTALLFAHGFNVHYGSITPRDDLDVILVAPKGPGDLVRREYVSGHGVPCLQAVHQDASGQAANKAAAYAEGIGGGRAGVMQTTFAEETETDLFGEQTVLCGGVSELVLKGFETLVEAGYQPEVAYFECMHELKLIVDLLHEGGFGKMYEFISDTASYGDLVSGPRVIDDHVKTRMKQVLEDIQDGSFAERWMAEHRSGGHRYRQLMAERTAHPIEKTGSALRARMSWLNPTTDETVSDARRAS